jgi:hypothetical protein
MRASWLSSRIICPRSRCGLRVICSHRALGRSQMCDTMIPCSVSLISSSVGSQHDERKRASPEKGDSARRHRRYWRQQREGADRSPELPVPQNASFQSLSWEAVRVDRGHIDPSVFAFAIPASYRRLASPIASQTKTVELLKELDSVSILQRPADSSSGPETK